MKTNQSGGSYSAKKPSAPAKELAANQKGAAKYGHRGAADFPEKGTQEHKASVKHSGSGEHLGAKRMGYNQSFGAARMGGYAKGAAKVANIMSFGASKYGHYGAADAGHGGVEGHEHPQMTTTQRTTSGGGGSASNSSTSGGENSSSTQSTNNLSSYQAGLKDLGSSFKPTPAQTAAANARVAELKKKDEAAKAANASASTSSNSSSTNTNPGSSTTTSSTIVSPNSMAETILNGNIQNENRVQKFNFDRQETQIAAANDSTAAANYRLNRLPAYIANSPKGQVIAGKAGALEAADTRRNSGLFSREEIKNMYQTGQGINQ